jgi:hypothetical protein
MTVDEKDELVRRITAFIRAYKIQQGDHLASFYNVSPDRTIGILAETTTGIEPIFCAAYKRRYLKGNIWNYKKENQ